MNAGSEPWQPIGSLPAVSKLIDNLVRVAREHHAALLETRPKPHVLNRALVANIERLSGEGLEACDVYEEQVRRWRDECPKAGQRRALQRLESATCELRLLLAQILALADEIATATVGRRQLGSSEAESGRR